MIRPDKHNGFTLIELSIVLVIIGLIIGGVLVGRDLIRAAEIRATISQLEKYNTAVNTFRVKYGGLPGDLFYKQASQYGFFVFSDGGNEGTFGEGDSNGFIEDQDGYGAFRPDDPTVYTPTDAGQVGGEQYVFWRHLSDAKLIDGNFGSDLLGDGSVPVITSNASKYFPPAKIGNNLYFVAYDDSQYNYFALGVLTGAQPENAGQTTPYLNALTSNYGLTPIEARAIDVKIDDGRPNAGRVYGISPYWGAGTGVPGNWSVPTWAGGGFCLTGGTGQYSTSAVYNTGQSVGGNEPSCTLEFRFN